MTSLVNLTNVKLALEKKARDYTLTLACGTTALAAASGPGPVAIAANSTSSVAFTDVSLRALKVGTTIPLAWCMSVDKKDGNAPKKYEKTATVAVGSKALAMTVLLGKIGSLHFTADAPNEDAAQRQQEEARRAAAAQEEQQRKAAEEAERQRQAQLAEQQRAKAELDNAGLSKLVVDEAEERKRQEAEFDVAYGMLGASKQQLHRELRELKDAWIAEIASRPPAWPALHPQLRIAKLFVEPPYEPDPVFDAICAPPPPPTAQAAQLPPPAPLRGDADDTSHSAAADGAGTAEASGGGGSASPEPRSVQQRRATTHTSSPSATAPTFHPRETPLDVLYAAVGDVDSLSPVRGRGGNNSRFTASAFEEDFGPLDTEDPDYQPGGKLSTITSSAPHCPSRCSSRRRAFSVRPSRHWDAESPTSTRTCA